jgi:hypothetical protein
VLHLIDCEVSSGFQLEEEKMAEPNLVPCEQCTMMVDIQLYSFHLEEHGISLASNQTFQNMLQLPSKPVKMDLNALKPLKKEQNVDIFKVMKNRVKKENMKEDPLVESELQ